MMYGPRYQLSSFLDHCFSSVESYNQTHSPSFSGSFLMHCVSSHSSLFLARNSSMFFNANFALGGMSKVSCSIQFFIKSSVSIGYVHLVVSQLSYASSIGKIPSCPQTSFIGDSPVDFDTVIRSAHSAARTFFGQ